MLQQYWLRGGRHAAAVDDSCADPEMLRPHYSAAPNLGHLELGAFRTGAQSGRKNQLACLSVCSSVCR